MDAKDAKSGAHLSDGQEVLDNNQRPIASTYAAVYMDQHVFFQNSGLPDSQQWAEQDDHHAEARQTIILFKCYVAFTINPQDLISGMVFWLSRFSITKNIDS